MSIPAAAQSRDYRIPPSDLKRALDLFAQQTGYQVIYRSADIRGRRSQGAGGRLTSGSALGRILAGNGLSWRVQPSGAIAIVQSETGIGAETPRPGRSGAPGLHEGALIPDIVVTGSRLSSVTSLPSLTTVIRREELIGTGETAIGESLNDLPGLRSTLARSNSTQIDTGAGLNMLDLRGLGIDRTLVLQNGRRHIAGATFSTAVDVNTIPVDLIDRVEILTGGSSAVYGSDAVGGVVNFVLKKDFHGFAARAQRGISSHGDAAQTFLSASLGGNFAASKGNIALAAEYARHEGLYASERSAYRNLAAYRFVDTDPSMAINGSDGTPDRRLFDDVRGSSVSDGGTFVIFNSLEDTFARSYLFQPDGRLVEQIGERAGLPPNSSFNGGNGTNLRAGRLFSYAPDVRRFSLNLIGHLELSEVFEPFLEAKHVQIRSHGSSFGSFFSVGAWGPRERYRTDNPYLQPEARAFLRDQYELTGDEESAFYFRRNFAELGPVAQHNRRDTSRLVLGARGRITGEWAYEVSANAAQARSRSEFSSNINVQRFLLAIDAVRDPATGEIVCRSKIDPQAARIYEDAVRPDFAQAQLDADVRACVPLNPFGEGNISAAARRYLLADGFTRSRIRQFLLNGFVSGDSSGWLDLPGGPVGLVFGAEYRRETFRERQDILIASGVTHATALPDFAPPQFSVVEGFGEMRLPLLRDVRGAEELTLSMAARLARYEAGIGTVVAWNGGAQWEPIKGIRLRANRSRAVRAPNSYEIYQPLGQSFTTGVIRDPCSVQSIGSGSASREANCMADGVPPGFDLTFPTSLPFLKGGNRDLVEERSDSLTLGAALQPRILAGFSFSIDFYRVRVRNVITSPSVQSILNACYDAISLQNQFCSLFERYQGPTPGPAGETSGAILHNSLHVVPLNYAGLRVSGLDAEAAYRKDVADVGTINAHLRYTLALQNDSHLDPDNSRRRDQNLLELGNPRHALNLDVGLQKGRMSIGYKLRHVSKMSIGAIENIRSIQGRPPEDADAFERDFFPAATYHDARIEWAATSTFGFYGGVDNLTNRLPPPSVTGVDDAGAIYDTNGRYFYVGLTTHF